MQLFTQQVVTMNKWGQSKYTVVLNFVMQCERLIRYLA